MGETHTGTEILTLGDLKALLQRFDLPDDAIVLMESDDINDPRGTIELPVGRVVGSRGYGERSRIVFGWRI